MNLYWFKTLSGMDGYAVADTLGVVDDTVGPLSESKLVTQNVLVLSPVSVPSPGSGFLKIVVLDELQDEG